MQPGSGYQLIHALAAADALKRDLLRWEAAAVAPQKAYKETLKGLDPKQLTRWETMPQTVQQVNGVWASPYTASQVNCEHLFCYFWGFP